MESGSAERPQPAACSLAREGRASPSHSGRASRSGLPASDRSSRLGPRRATASGTRVRPHSERSRRPVERATSMRASSSAAERVEVGGWGVFVVVVVFASSPSAAAVDDGGDDECFSARGATRLLAALLRLVLHAGRRFVRFNVSHRADWSEEDEASWESAATGPL